MSQGIGADSFEEETPAAESQALVVPEISKLSDEDKASAGHALEQEIIDDSQQVMARYLRIGRNLHLVSKNHLYKLLGYESFDEWRAQPEMGLSRATSYALMKVFDTFIERLKVDYKRLEGVDWTKLYAISQFVNAENVEDYLEKVKTLSRTDLQREAALTRARLKGKTETEAEAQVAVLDIVREACPINCGSRCSLIDNDHDAAVSAFKKYLGRWRSLSARIKSLFGTEIKAAKHERKADTEGVPPETDPAASASGG